MSEPTAKDAVDGLSRLTNLWAWATVNMSYGTASPTAH